MTNKELCLLRYALEAPSWDACKILILRIIHGCTGADNVDVCATSAYKRDAKQLLLESTENWGER